MNQRPNILFVLTDQQTRGALRAGGNPFLHTPHMDALTRRGVWFWNSYCAAPVCGPARASLLTGRMPHQTGVQINDQLMRPGLPTLGEIFQASGYETAWAGKCHLPTPYPTAVDAIGGFENLVLPSLPNPELGTGVDDAVVDQAVRFIHQPHSHPYLLGVSLHNPHDICYWIMEPEREALARFTPSGDLPPLPDNFASDPNEPEFIQRCRRRDHYGNELQWTTTWDERRWRTYLAVYYRMVEQADACLGRILEAVRTAGREEDTLILFTSDHGEGVAAHRWVVKLMLYEEPVTVPFIISGTGRTCRGQLDKTQLVSGIDVLPTLCDFAGIHPPSGIPGRSLRAAAEGSPVAAREFIISELLPDPQRAAEQGRMLRTQRFKYIVFSHGARPELLFDLERDPGETRNLAAHPRQQAVRDQHRALLASWIQDTGDTFAMQGSLIA